MRVLKVINNNVISCLDDRGRETVVMGKGLGFKARPGMQLNPDEAEKIFRMESQEQAARLMDLFATLPGELLELCEEIIDYADKILERRLNETIYLTLTDHIQFAITRCRQGIVTGNVLQTEVRVFYPEEYAIGSYAIHQIERKLGVKLPEDEAASIALHIINAEYDRSMNVTMRAAKMLHPVVQILNKAQGLTLDTESLYYDELLVHLKFMAMNPVTQEDRAWEDASQILQQRIPAAWHCAEQICSYFYGETGNRISQSELSYLTICIHRACKTH